MNVMTAAMAAEGEKTKMTTPTPGRKGVTIQKGTGKHATKEVRPPQRRGAVARLKADQARRAGQPQKTAVSRKGDSTARRGSKTAKILELLKRPGGATLKEIMKATAWQSHSVRFFLSGTLRKKLGMRVDSFKRNDNERTYRISSK
jgi:hypothetical protein